MTRNDIRRGESYIFTVRIIVCSYNTNGMPDSRVYPVVFNERFNRGIEISLDTELYRNDQPLYISVVIVEINIKMLL